MSLPLTTYLLHLRGRYGDQHALDLLQIAELLDYAPGLLLTTQLADAWHVHPSNISRRVAALHTRGLIDATRRAGGYSIHHLALSR